MEISPFKWFSASLPYYQGLLVEEDWVEAVTPRLERDWRGRQLEKPTSNQNLP